MARKAVRDPVRLLRPVERIEGSRSSDPVPGWTHRAEGPTVRPAIRARVDAGVLRGATFEMTSATRLTAAGFVATAIAFGPARMGFGLFLPAFREEFALSIETAGLIASAGFLAFLLALLASAWVGRRYGERASVVTGASTGVAGFAAVAMAETSGVLAVGIALAGTSAGFCWTPFNDAAERVVRHEARATALSVVSTGTSFGVIAAAGLAFAVAEGALHWRGAWGGFALGGLALVAIAWVGLPSPRRADPGAGGKGPRRARPS